MTASPAYNAHYLAIGRMLVVFQSLEATLKDGLVLLLNNNLGTPGGQLAYATISELSFATASRIASALPAAFTVDRIGYKSPESAKRLKEALADAETQLNQGIKIAGEVEQRRNQLVHSRWFIHPGIVVDPGTMIRMKTRTKAGSMTVNYEPESIADVDANTAKARQARSLIGSALSGYNQIAQDSW